MKQTRIRQLTEQEKRSIGEQQMIADWLKIFPKGILSIVSDTFDLWKLITEYLPANKEAIMARDGKLVIRPDSGNPVDIICGHTTNGLLHEKGKYYIKGDYTSHKDRYGAEVWGSYEKGKEITLSERKGVIELLWDIFGGTINEQGYKVLDPHIGAIYGDSITPDRQREIYERLAAKGFAATNIVLGVGSYTYEYTTRDWASMAAKGSWFEVEEHKCEFNGKGCTKYPEGGMCADYLKDECRDFCKKSYNIYKDPVTDDGTKRSLKGLLAVTTESLEPDSDEKIIVCYQECTPEEESKGLLQVIYEDGKFYNQTSLTEIRNRLNNQ